MTYQELKFLFETSESDNESIYKDVKGNFWSKRYGLPLMQVKRAWAESQAWFEANRKGKFLHLRYFEPGEQLPKLSNPEAQKFIVSLMLQD